MSFEVVEPTGNNASTVARNGIMFRHWTNGQKVRCVALSIGADIVRHLGLVRDGEKRLLEIAFGKGDDLGKIRLAAAAGSLGFRLTVYRRGTARTGLALPEELRNAPDDKRTMTAQLLTSERTGQPYVICDLPAGYVDRELARAARAEI